MCEFVAHRLCLCSENSDALYEAVCTSACRLCSCAVLYACCTTHILTALTTVQSCWLNIIANQQCYVAYLLTTRSPALWSALGSAEMNLSAG
jgi:hypothetical protein